MTATIPTTAAPTSTAPTPLAPPHADPDVPHEEPSAIAGQVVVLRPSGPQHQEAFHAILSHPDVAAWWGGYDLDRVRRELLGPNGYAVELAGEVVGLVIYYEVGDPDHRHAGLDVALHPEAHGQGLGADAMRTVLRYLFDVRGHHRVVIDPAAHNERAIRSYERVGFRRIGVMRRYERRLGGGWHDGLLMDLLAEDFHAG